MYFQDRTAAGHELAKHLDKYRDDDVVVATLSDSAYEIGRVITSDLRLNMTTFITKVVNLPGEGLNYGTLDQTGHLTHNSAFSQGEIDEYDSEYHNYIEAEKITKTHEINSETSSRGLENRQQFIDKIVILVSDGLDETTVLDSAFEYLKPIRLKRLVVAVPVASVAAVDKMHVGCDEIHCLSVTENYISTEHYYNCDKFN
jgi:predicted phosphoribosyltransferase